MNEIKQWNSHWKSIFSCSFLAASFGNAFACHDGYNHELACGNPPCAKILCSSKSTTASSPSTGNSGNIYSGSYYSRRSSSTSSISPVAAAGLAGLAVTAVFGIADLIRKASTPSATSETYTSAVPSPTPSPSYNDHPTQDEIDEFNRLFDSTFKESMPDADAKADTPFTEGDAKSNDHQTRAVPDETNGRDAGSGYSTKPATSFENIQELNLSGSCESVEKKGGEYASQLYRAAGSRGPSICASARDAKRLGQITVKVAESCQQRPGWEALRDQGLKQIGDAAKVISYSCVSDLAEQ